MSYIQQGFRFMLLLVFCVLVQAIIWHSTDFTDKRVWTTRTENLATDLYQLSPPVTAHYSGHPGMTVLIPAALLHVAGLAAEESLRWSMAFVNGIIVACIFRVARALQPHSVWWLAAGTIVLAQPLHLQASPTNTIMATLTVLIMLLAWYVYTRPPQLKQYLLFLGIALGAGLATRFVFAGALCLAIGFLTALRFRKKLAFLAIVALVSFVLFDPLLWSDPVTHIVYMLGRADTHFSNIDALTLRYSDFLLFAPFAIFSLLTWLLLLVPKLKQYQPIPHSVGWVLFIFTVVITVIYLDAQGKSLRYFYPLIFVWESLLPLFLISLSAHISWPDHMPYKNTIQRLFPAGLGLSVAAAEIFLLLYALHLPAQRELIDWHYISPLLRPHSKQEQSQVVR